MTQLGSGPSAKQRATDESEESRVPTTLLQMLHGKIQ